ncbi:MAG: MBL fold metallo-hydrolase [Candidatus Thorarchaeota archaeon]
MKTQQVGSRGMVFIFDDFTTPEYECPTNVYVIIGNKNVYVCDTFLGPDSMKEVKEYLAQKCPQKPITVFNSHHDWDHHWGNCAFPNSRIIAHELCLEKMDEEALNEMEKNKDQMKGKVIYTPPNVLFKNILLFDEDEIKIFYSPGHTIDSSSLYDMKDKILFAGDNLERPIPYLTTNLNGLKEYITSLDKYNELEIKQIIPGHGPISTTDILKDNYEYLSNFPDLEKVSDKRKDQKSYLSVHIMNLNKIAEMFISEGNKAEAKNYWEIALDLSEKNIDLLSKETSEKIKAKIASL